MRPKRGDYGPIITLFDLIICLFIIVVYGLLSLIYIPYELWRGPSRPPSLPED
jgi:hypothetical protein